MSRMSRCSPPAPSWEPLGAFEVGGTPLSKDVCAVQNQRDLVFLHLPILGGQGVPVRSPL